VGAGIVPHGGQKLMRDDNMLWVLIIPGLASCACFALELCSNFSEKWNQHFESFRRGFEIIGRYNTRLW
jgi:hypothetical protein